MSPTHFKEYDSGILQVLRNGLSKWEILKELIAKYEQQLNYNEIDYWKDRELNQISAPKGEFETTLQYNDRLKIIRPFLNLNKTDLKYVTLNYFKTYIRDPSNEDEKFLRVRIRKYRKKMENAGLDTRKIIKTIENLISANQAINFYKNKALYKYASFVSKNKCLLNKQIFSEEAKEITFKSFSDILSLVSGTYYPPRSKKVINLIDRLKKDKFTKSTLGGCIVEKKDNFILISKELKIRKMLYQPGK